MPTIDQASEFALFHRVWLKLLEDTIEQNPGSRADVLAETMLTVAVTYLAKVQGQAPCARFLFLLATQLHEGALPGAGEIHSPTPQKNLRRGH